MKNTILKPNATPIYSFLSFIEAQQILPEFGKQLKILDCGAGGPVPPLALFNEHGFDTYGIDISDQQLKQAKQYSKKQGIQITFAKQICVKFRLMMKVLIVFTNITPCAISVKKILQSQSVRCTG